MKTTQVIRDANPKAKRVGEAVYEVLFERLMDLTISPGGRITVDSLVREFGVSQTPIREALSRLEAQGLVEKQHLIGYRAAQQLGVKDLSDLFGIRLLIEPYAAAQCIKNISDKDILRLRETEIAMSSLFDDEKSDYLIEFAKLDGVFHEIISNNCGNELIKETLDRLHVHTHLFRLIYLNKEAYLVVNEHTCITDAILKKDPEQAFSAMETHLRNTHDRFVHSLEIIKP